ncbi:hypothetical protein GS157_002920 [Salmonella enterica]|nr:hypothetical protein [Salmonella enterica]EEK5737686.1 hypothetical protein [Salmonella enterica]EEL9952927.1 hypothetical protein [Salmonella enterica]EEM1605865.1 hypothetical protein [Salmonella enterica]
MLVSSNLPRLAIKRALQDVLTEDMGLDLNVEQTQQGFTQDVTAWITGMEESFTRVNGSKAFSADLVITVQLYSQFEETAVHDAIRSLILLSPTNQRFIDTGIHITDINPIDSATNYGDENTDGGVIGTLSIKFSYLARF